MQLILLENIIKLGKLGIKLKSRMVMEEIFY